LDADYVSTAAAGEGVVERVTVVMGRNLVVVTATKNVVGASDEIVICAESDGV